MRLAGYAFWEQMQRVLDGMFKATAHKNARNDLNSAHVFAVLLVMEMSLSIPLSAEVKRMLDVADVAICVLFMADLEPIFL